MEARLGRSVTLLHAAFSVFPDSFGTLAHAPERAFHSKPKDGSHETSLRKAFCHTLKHLGIEVEVVGMHTATWDSGLRDDDFL